MIVDQESIVGGGELHTPGSFSPVQKEVMSLGLRRRGGRKGECHFVLCFILPLLPYLPFSSSPSSLLPPLPSSPLHLSLLTIGYLEGTFDLIWRKQTTDGPGEEEVALEWKSSATLHEMDMPSEPTKSYLLIRERQDGTTPQRAQQVTAHVIG